MPQFTLKCGKPGTSDAIIVSFHSKWHEPMRCNEIEVVFRKTGPKQFVPRWMYAYVATPISAIAARFSVTSATVLPLDEAVQYCRGVA